MKWLTTKLNQIPERWRWLARQHGVWVVLVGGGVMAWIFNSGYDLVRVNRFLTKEPDYLSGFSGFYRSMGYVLGYVIAALIKFPHRFLPILAVMWALAVLHYRYLFKPLIINTSGLKKGAYGIALWLVWLGAKAGVTAWLGFDRLSDFLAGLWMGLALLFAVWAYFRRLRHIRWQLTAQKTRAELDALKAQINPHFLFNSLNNIFGTALTENGPRTANSVQQLASMLRYMLEQANSDRASIGAELRFLDEYVLLQKQRMPENELQRIHFSYDWDEIPAQVAPLLLSPLLDYAFRQRQVADAGVLGFLRADALVQDGQLQFKLDYTCSPRWTDTADELQNVRQRLTLIYPDRHQFTVRTENNTAHLILTINLN